MQRPEGPRQAAPPHDCIPCGFCRVTSEQASDETADTEVIDIGVRVRASMCVWGCLLQRSLRIWSASGTSTSTPIALACTRVCECARVFVCE